MEDKFKDVIKDNIRANLKLCKVENIDEYKLDYAFRLSMSELIEALKLGALSEYFLLEHDLYLAKYYNEEYRKQLKGLL